MRIVLLLAILFVSGLLFLPGGDGTGIRNVPLLVTILAVLGVVFLVGMVRAWRLKFRTCRALKKAGFTIVGRKRTFARHIVTAERRGTVYEIPLLRRRRTKGRYHFDDTDTLSFYKTTAPMYKTNPVTGNYAVGHAETARAGGKKLRWTAGDAAAAPERMLLFDRMPERITDGRCDHDLGAGDAVCGSDVRVYDLPSFCTYLDTLSLGDRPDAS